ncbi:T9SS type A sorting domain-containing protein [Chitinophagaceae bacterium MMS25-I14]
MIRLQKHFVGSSTCVILSLVLFFFSQKSTARTTTTPPDPKALSHQLTGSSLSFTENRGQVADMAGNIRRDVLFTTNNGHTKLFLTATGIYYQFTQTAAPAGNKTGSEKQAETKTHRFSVSLEGGNPHPNVIREEKTAAVQNFYLAQCPNGITNVASYKKLTYQEVYPHIDWVLYSKDNHLKYDFIVKPGGNPALIKLKISDAENVTITESGELLMKTGLGEIKEKAPLSYADGSLVKSSFRKNNDGTIGFEVAVQPGKELRIDPAVVWSTYFGGTATEAGYGCTTDGNGHIYITGMTTSASGIATSGGFQTTYGSANDAFLAKFDSSGYLLWATYFGGSGNDQGYACVKDGSGNVYISGQTASSGMAYGTVFQTTYGGANDAFLAKFDASGNRIWATYYGGTGADNPVAGFQSLCIDAGNNLYLCGNTASGGMATSGTFQTTQVGNIAFLAKFDATGNRIWGTYYNGTGSSCAVDGSGNVFLSGNASATATNISSTSAHQTVTGGGTDAYLAKFDVATGNRAWGTFYGGTGAEAGNFCTADGSGNVYLSGTTTTATGTAIATSGSYQNTLGGGTDGFLVKFNASGVRQWGTYIGGSVTEQPTNGLLDPSGNVYILGSTSSSNNIAYNGFQNTIGSASANDAFLMEFDPSGNRLFGTYFGGTAADIGVGCAMDGSGNIYFSGQAASATNIAHKGTYQQTRSGTNDAFLVKVGNLGLFTDSIAVIPVCAGSTITVPYSLFGVYNTGNVFTAQLSDSSGSFASPVNIGTVTSTTAGTITATIPLTTLTGTHYRIRVTGSNPFIIGTNNGDDLTINASVSTAVSIAANPGNSICLGSSVTFTATPTNGGTAPTYQWLKNNTATGTNSAAYTNASLANNDTISVIMTSNALCALPATDTSNKIVMTVTPQLTPSVTIAANPSGAICAGTSVTFTATPVNGGTAPVYQWTKNGANVGTNSATYTDNTLATGDIIAVTMTSNASCTSTTPVASNNITMTVNPLQTPSVSITANPAGAICAGTSVTFTATPTSGGTTPVYQWKKNGANVGTNSATYTDNGLATGDVVTVTMTSNALCTSTTPVTSNGITMTVNPLQTPSVSIAVNPAGAICAGTSVTFTATPTNGGTTPVYQWKKNGTNVGTNSATYTDNGLATGDIITVTMTSDALCTSTTPVSSNSITMTVNPVVTPSVTITANPGNTVCAGTAVTFTATPVNGGSAPTYQWKKNGANVGANNPTYTDNGLVSSDVITVVMTSNAPCTSTAQVTSNSITMTVNPVVTPAVTIAANPGNTICAGTAVTFTATPVNGGTTPAYQWKKNGANVGTNNPTYTDNGLVSSDVITVTMTSNAPCASTAPVASNSITMTINPVVTPSVTIIANPGNTICAGTSVMFTAILTNGGTAPALQWKKNGVNVSATSSYTTNSLANGDIITVTMTSNAACTSVNPVTSNSITMTVTTPVIPAVSISPAPNDTICVGTSVTFTPTSNNGGTAPSYQWKKNGVNVGTGSSYIDNGLATGDIINVIMTSNATCVTTTTATSNNVTMVVNTPVTSSVSIAANASSPICSGTAVTYTATPTNGGTTPSYQWKKNGVNVGSNSDTYIASGLANNDVITVVMSSSLPCTSASSVTSNSITMNVFPVLTPSVSIIAAPGDTLCTGAIATFTATGTNGGTSPAYQWKKNGQNVGFNSNIYTDNTLTTGDNISVVYTSNAVCVTNANANSNVIGVVVNPCCDTPANITFSNITAGANFNWNAVPNVAGYQYAATQSATPPVTGSFATVSFASVTNLQPGTYYFWVRTHCGNGIYSPWVRIMFTVVPAGIKNTSADGFSIKVYPNPVHDIATVKVDNMFGRKATLQLTDVSGRVIGQDEMNSSDATVHLDGLASGMYLLHYNDGLHNEVIKINKQ